LILPTLDPIGSNACIISALSLTIQAECFNGTIFKPSGKYHYWIFLPEDSWLILIFKCMSMKKGEDRENKNPAYAVLITILNLFNKWAPGVVCFRLSTTRPAEQGGHAHHKQV
jgi:hypothetical protein